MEHQPTAQPGFALRQMMRMRGLAEIAFTVTEVSQLTPRMRRVSLTSGDLDGFAPKPGQDMLLLFPGDGGEAERRHYTIRGFNRAAARVDVDFVLHDANSPAGRWTLAAQPGDGIVGFGPRGRNVLHPGADWRLFVGDETCIPAILGMIEALSPGAPARAFIEIAFDEDRQPVETAGDARIAWLVRSGPPALPSRLLIESVAGFALPEGVGHAYIIGETSAVRAIRHDIIARGMPKERIFAEGYWRPGRIGGHDHV